MSPGSKAAVFRRTRDKAVGKCRPALCRGGQGAIIWSCVTTVGTREHQGLHQRRCPLVSTNSPPQKLCLQNVPSKWYHCCFYCCFASVMSNSVRPHRWQATRLHCPWDSPGKNTGVGCHFLLQCMKVKSESEIARSCPTLLDPMDYRLPGSSVHGIFQARVLEWAAIAFSG